ncbi:Uu.00g068810.m01.CDS01 [Anthostomella pinea]|uniref:Uu.00g068810.m01.CDS01 n=1 Tax=Anthostomella pinea TaxID=933095 RepID=A0AAI8YNM2_9PEZI|nr:Uu.00g068810.m01.CDS01 [Anthostomella pinea]
MAASETYPTRYILHASPLDRQGPNGPPEGSLQLSPHSDHSAPQYPSSRSWNHTASPSIEPEESDVVFQPKIIQPKRELLGFLDQYDETTVDEHLEYLRDPYMRKYAPADGPNLSVSDRTEDVELQSVGKLYRGRSRECEEVQLLRKALYTKLRHPGRVGLDTIWALYQAVPEPRAAHMSSSVRHLLFATLSTTERKDHKSMLRYFAVVADVKNSGFTLTRKEWHGAMSFASRYVATTTEVETEAALRLWRDMEVNAGIKGNEVTFNILFDSASKAGKFNLAEMIYEEMTTRGFPFSRYHHVSLIHFFGLKQVASGVRAAYKEMIEAGEIIDTVVLNCVIAGFIRCGEEDAADRVYEKMKASNANLKVVPHRDYTMQKSITKVLMMFAKVGKKHPDMRSNFQQAALLSPDLRTYRILITHYGVRLGDLTKVSQFLDEMKLYKVPLHGSIFLALFKSFAVYGGRGSDWSSSRLDSVWDAFLSALDSGADGLTIGTWLAMAVLNAFSKHSSRDQLLDIYECLRSRWDLNTADSEFMLGFLNRLLQGDDLINRRKGGGTGRGLWS